MSSFRGLDIEIDENGRLRWIIFDNEKPYNGCWHIKKAAKKRINALVDLLESTLPTKTRRMLEAERPGKAGRKDRKAPLYSIEDVTGVLCRCGTDDAYRAMSELTGFSKDDLQSSVFNKHYEDSPAS